MKALCLYVDGGKGHYVPAKAVQIELEKRGIETKFEEFFEYLDIQWMGKINKFFWRTMLRMPSIEQHISKHNDADSNGMDSAIKFAKKHCKRIMRSNLEEFRPDFVFATHPYASTIISELLFDMQINIPVYYFATDVFSAPVASICNKLRKYFIATKEGAEIVEAMGQPKDSIIISPFPLQQVVAESPKLGKKESRKKLGLDEDVFTLQVNLGGEGIGSLKMVEALIKNNDKMQIVVIGGIDSHMKKKLDKMAYATRNSNVKLVVAGFVKNVNEYLAASDIIAGRAGINTIVEAIYAHRPFLITDLVYTVIPSADYIEKYNIGWNCASDTNKQVSVIAEYVKNPKLLEVLEDNFSKVPIVYSAGALAEMLIEDQN